MIYCNVIIIYIIPEGAPDYRPRGMQGHVHMYIYIYIYTYYIYIYTHIHIYIYIYVNRGPATLTILLDHFLLDNEA